MIGKGWSIGRENGRGPVGEERILEGMDSQVTVGDTRRTKQGRERRYSRGEEGGGAEGYSGWREPSAGRKV